MGQCHRSVRLVDERTAESQKPTQEKKTVPKKTTAVTGTKKESAVGARMFEFSDGKSNKFWEIAVEGTDVTVRYGRMGSDGQTKTKSFADEDAANAHAEKSIVQKTGKGYEEV